MTAFCQAVFEYRHRGDGQRGAKGDDENSCQCPNNHRSSSIASAKMPKLCHLRWRFYLAKAYVIVRTSAGPLTFILPLYTNRQHDTHITAGSVTLSQYVDSRAFGHHIPIVALLVRCGANAIVYGFEDAMIGGVLKKVFGSANDRMLARLKGEVDAINAFELKSKNWTKH